MTDMTAGGNSATKQDNFSAAPWPTVRKVLEIAGWLALALLLFTGITSIFGRAVFVTEALSAAVDNPSEVYNPFDIRYYEHYLATFLHLGPGLLIFCLGPLQFIPAIRKKWLNFHRWSGRTFLICGVISAFSGMYVGVIYPFAGIDGQGFNESMATAFFGAYTLFCIVKAYTSIRRREIGLHREWMIRTWALMLAIATERVMLGIFLANTSIGIEVLFGTTFWMAAMINIACAETWINLTRTPGNGARHWKDLDAKAAG